MSTTNAQSPSSPSRTRPWTGSRPRTPRVTRLGGLALAAALQAASSAVADPCDGVLCGSDLIVPMPVAEASVELTGSEIPSVVLAGGPVHLRASASAILIAAAQTDAVAEISDVVFRAQLVLTYEWTDADGAPQVQVQEAIVTGAADPGIASASLDGFAAPGTLDLVRFEARSVVSYRVLFANEGAVPMQLGYELVKIAASAEIEDAGPLGFLGLFSVDATDDIDAALTSPCGELAPGEQCTRLIAVGDCSLAEGDGGADLNGDERVAFADLVGVLSYFGATCDLGAPCPGDVNGDGEVDHDDVMEILMVWGPCD